MWPSLIWRPRSHGPPDIGFCHPVGEVFLRGLLRALRGLLTVLRAENPHKGTPTGVRELHRVLDHRMNSFTVFCAPNGPCRTVQDRCRTGAGQVQDRCRTVQDRCRTPKLTRWAPASCCGARVPKPFFLVLHTARNFAPDCLWPQKSTSRPRRRTILNSDREIRQPEHTTCRILYKSRPRNWGGRQINEGHR